MIAQIIINSNARALNRIFDYMVPSNLENKIKIGTRVFVPFGNGKKLEDGFVIGIANSSEFANKYINKIAEEQYLDENKIILAKHMAKKYFCNISDCIKLMLPPGTASNKIEKRTGSKFGDFIYLNKSEEEIINDIENKKIRSGNHIKILDYLKDNNGIYVIDIEKELNVHRNMINALEKKGYIKIEKKTIERNPFKNKSIKHDKKIKLNDEQQNCFNEIEKSIENEEFSNNLIFGITGSRKNRNIFAINRKGNKKW